MTNHAWEAICWFALVCGLLSMWAGRRWIDRATAAVKEANQVYAAAIKERRETIELLRPAAEPESKSETN